MKRETFQTTDRRPPTVVHRPSSEMTTFRTTARKRLCVLKREREKRECVGEKREKEGDEMERGGNEMKRGG